MLALTRTYLVLLALQNVFADLVSTPDNRVVDSALLDAAFEDTLQYYPPPQSQRSMTDFGQVNNQMQKCILLALQYHATANASALDLIQSTTQVVFETPSQVSPFPPASSSSQEAVASTLKNASPGLSVRVGTAASLQQALDQRFLPISPADSVGAFTPAIMSPDSPSDQSGLVVSLPPVLIVTLQVLFFLRSCVSVPTRHGYIAAYT